MICFISMGGDEFMQQRRKRRRVFMKMHNIRAKKVGRKQRELANLKQENFTPKNSPSSFSSDEEIENCISRIVRQSAVQYDNNHVFSEEEIDDCEQRLQEERFNYLTDVSEDSLILYMNHLSLNRSCDRLYPSDNYFIIIRKDQLYMQRKEDNALYHLNLTDEICQTPVHVIVDMINNQYPKGGTTQFHTYDVVVGFAHEHGSGYVLDNRRIRVPTPPRVKRERTMSSKMRKRLRKKNKSKNTTTVHTEEISTCARFKRNGFVPNSDLCYVIDNHTYTEDDMTYLIDIFGDKLTPQSTLYDEFALTMGTKFTAEQLNEFVMGLSSKVTTETSHAFGMLEGFLLAVVSVFDAQTFVGQCAAIAQYIRPYLNGNGSALIYVKECFSDCFGTSTSRGVDPIGLEPHSTMFSRVKEFRDLPVFRHCCTAATMLVGLGFIQQTNFTKDCAKKFALVVAPTQEKSKDFFSCVLDTLDFFLDRGYACFTTGSLEPFFNLNDEHTEFQTKLAFLKANIVEVRCGNFEDLHKDKTPRLTLGDFVSTIEYCRNYVKTNLATAAPSWKPTLAGYLSTIERIQNEYHIHAGSSSMRVAPFCVKIYGGSGVCKSSLYRYTINSILTYNNYDASDDKIVNLEPDDKFEPNMRSNINAVVFDDMANTASAFMAMAPTSKLIKIVNNAPCYANMPEADMKGKVLMNPKLVVITTNVEDLCAATYSNEPFSLLRRCHIHVEVKLRANLMDTDHKLDQSLLKQWESGSCSTYEDMWLIDMKMVREIPSITPHIKEASKYAFSPLVMAGVNNGLPLTGVDIYTYMKVCNMMSMEHFKIQGAVVAKQANLCLKAIHCECRGPINAQGYCVMCGSKDKLVLTPQSGLFTNMLTMTSMSMQMPKWQYTLATSTYGMFNGLLNSIVDTFTFSSMDKLVFDVMGRGNCLNYASVRDVDLNLFYGSPLIRLMSYCTPMYFKQDKFYNQMMMVFMRKHAYKRAYAGGLVNLIILLCFWKSPPIKRAGKSSPLIKGFFAGLFMSTWTICWSCCIKQSMELAIARDIERTRLMIVAEEKWTLENNRPSLNTVLRWGTFGIVGAGVLRLAVSMISQSYNTFYNLVEEGANEAQPIKDTHSAIANVTQEDIVERDSATNVWAGCGSTFCADTMMPPQFLNKIAGGTLSMQIEIPDKPGVYRRTTAIMLKQGLVMYPRHNWFVDKMDDTSRLHDTLTVKFVRSPTNVGMGGTYWTENVYWTTTYVIPGTDIAISRIHLGGPFLDLVPYFHDTMCSQKLFVAQGRDVNGVLFQKRGALSYVGKMNLPFYSDVKCEYYQAELNSGSWANGDCATVIVNDGPKPRICGLHLLGADGKPQGLSVKLTRSVLELALVAIDKLLDVHNTWIPNSLVSVPKRIGDLEYNILDTIHPASPVNKMPEDHCLNTLGTINTTTTYKSEYKHSKLSDYLKDNTNVADIWMPPAFKKKDGWDPWQVIVDKISKPSSKMNPHLLRLAVDDWCDGLNFNDQDLSYLKPLTNTEILCGVDGKRFIDGIKMQTSCGYPMKGKKSKYIVPVDVETHARGLDFVSEYQKVWTWLSELEKDYEQNIKKGFIFKTSLKDEMVTKQKARGFYCAPLLLALHMRKYITPILRLMCMNPLLTECAVGLNPFCLEWHELHEFLTFFGEDQIVAGDHQSWDLKQNASLMIGGAKCIRYMATFGTYSEFDNKQIKGCLDEIIYPLVDVNGTVVQPFGMMTSGHNATANWNSIDNSLSLRCAFFHFYPDRVFRDYVHLITYGDDFVCGVSKECPLFNFNSIKAFYKDQCDMHVTFYDKTETAPNYSNIFDVDFLKRRSVLLGDTGKYVGAIDRPSIYKSLYWTRAKSSEENCVLIESITSQLHEMFYHGKEAYDDFVQHMSKALVHLGLTLPGLRVSFEDRLLLWKEKHMGLVLDYDSTPKTLYEAREFIGQHSDSLGETSHPFFAEKLGEWKVNYTLESIYEIKDSIPPCRVGGDLTHVSDVLLMTEATQLFFKDYVVQSAIEGGAEQDNTTNKLMDFQIRDGAFMSGLTHHQDETFDVAVSDGAAISDFMMRPLRIYDTDWGSFNALDFNLDLFNEYFSNARVANRVNNYGFISGTMCVRISCNGSPYHYGKALAGLNYWPLMDTALSSDGAINLYQLSQLPHIVINPTMGTAGCLEVPLYHPFNATSLINNERIVDLVFRTVNALSVAGPNPNDAPNIKLTIWCWMKNYKLMSPTSRDVTGLLPQSDEYQQKPVSRAATIAADAFGVLANIPQIGRYARISEAAMRMAGSLASSLGFSRPLSITEEMKISPRLISNLSNMNYSDSSTKLALDIKQEVTIDSLVTGYQEDNDMLLINVAKRESLVFSVPWTTSTNFLPKLIVSPMASPIGQNLDGYSIISSTPMAYISMPFNYWRGNLKIRIEVVGSAFHRGKIRIVYDPFDPVDNSWIVDSNINYSYIMDIANEREYVMDVGWASNRPFLNTGDPLREFFAASSELPMPDYKGECDNGTISIYVEHPLRSIEGDTDPFVWLNVYYAAGDDFQLAEPTDKWIKQYSNNFVNFIPQSIEETPGVGQAPIPDMMPAFNLNKSEPVSYSTNDKYDLTFFGERIVSIRQLVKRYCTNYTFTYNNEGADEQFAFFNYNRNDFPNYGGSTPNALDTGSLNGKATFAAYNNYLNWYTPIFLMRRGGVRNKYVFLAKEEDLVTDMAVARSEGPGTFFNRTTLDQALNYQWFVNKVADQSVLNGAQATLNRHNPVLEVDCPYYSPKRFFFAQDRDKETNFGDGDLRRECGHKLTFTAVMNSANGNVRRYTAAADDFSLYMFKYSPTIVKFAILAPYA